MKTKFFLLPLLVNGSITAYFLFASSVVLWAYIQSPMIGTGFMLTAFLPMLLPLFLFAYLSYFSYTKLKQEHSLSLKNIAISSLCASIFIALMSLTAQLLHVKQQARERAVQERLKYEEARRKNDQASPL